MIGLLIFFVFIVLYTYLFYPIFLILIGWIKNHHKKVIYEEKDKFYPTTSMVVPAYNEEEIIEEKLKNCMDLDCLTGHTEFIIGSDGSSDRTNELVKRCLYSDSRIKLFEFDRREGKASVLNKIIPGLKSEIVILSDADTVYEKDSIKNLIRHFADPKVGGVCGKLILVGDGNYSCDEEGVYWRYENRIKELESRIKTIASINGQIFAIRRSLFEPLPITSVTEDQVLGMRIIGRGYNILFEPEAICFEKARSLKSEFLRRVRISAGNFQSIVLSKGVLNPKTGFASLALWSHKILRWLVPFFLIGIFVSNIFLLRMPFFKILFFAQILFYLILPLHYILTRIGADIKIFRVIFYFILMDSAILIGFVKYLTRTQNVTWQKTR